MFLLHLSVFGRYPNGEILLSTHKFEAVMLFCNYISHYERDSYARSTLKVQNTSLDLIHEATLALQLRT